MSGNLIVTLPTMESTFAGKLIVTNSSNCQPWSLNFALGQPSTLPDYQVQIKRLLLALTLGSRGIALPKSCALYLGEPQQQSTFLETPISEQLSVGLRAVIRLLPPAGSRGYRLLLVSAAVGPLPAPNCWMATVRGPCPSVPGGFAFPPRLQTRLPAGMLGGTF